MKHDLMRLEPNSRSHVKDSEDAFPWGILAITVRIDKKGTTWPERSTMRSCVGMSRRASTRIDEHRYESLTFTLPQIVVDETQQISLVPTIYSRSTSDPPGSLAYKSNSIANRSKC